MKYNGIASDFLHELEESALWQRKCFGRSSELSGAAQMLSLFSTWSGRCIVTRPAWRERLYPRQRSIVSRPRAEARPTTGWNNRFACKESEGAASARKILR